STPTFWSGPSSGLVGALSVGLCPAPLGGLLYLLAGRLRVKLGAGLRPPPVGLNLYVAAGITKMGIGELTVAVLPWLGTMLIFLVMVTYIPEISLWLPRVLGMVN